MKWEKQIIVAEGGVGVQLVPKSAFSVVFAPLRRRFASEFIEITWENTKIVATDFFSTSDGQSPALGHHRFHQFEG